MKSKDSIYLYGMKFYGYHGALEEENKIGQRFEVDIILKVDLRKVGKSDDLNDTVNYAEVYNEVRNCVENKTFKLIERLAEDIAETILLKFNLVDSLSVKVKKPEAPIAGLFDFVAAKVKRGRNE